MNYSIDDIIPIINQVYEMEKKVSQKTELSSLQRNINRVRDILEEKGVTYHAPLGEAYNETRTDCDASISSDKTNNLVITDVIKPLIRVKQDNVHVIMQKAVVVVESK